MKSSSVFSAFNFGGATTETGRKKFDASGLKSSNESVFKNSLKKKIESKNAWSSVFNMKKEQPTGDRYEFMNSDKLQFMNDWPNDDEDKMLEFIEEAKNRIQQEIYNNTGDDISDRDAYKLIKGLANLFKEIADTDIAMHALINIGGLRYSEAKFYLSKVNELIDYINENIC